MNILVTGGAGYIGSHTCVELLNAGHQVGILDNLANSKREAVRRVEEITGKTVQFYQADLLDAAALRSIFASSSYDAVIHFAGLKAVGESVAIPLSYYENNMAGTIQLCKAMKEANVKCLVFSSSATVYGDPATVPIREDFPLSATNPYGRTKLMIEQMLGDLAKSDSSWSITLLRYFNPVGAHISGRIGEDPNGIPNNLVPYIAKVAVGKLPSLPVFGSDYPTPDGTGVRDYIHVVDLALGHIKALEAHARDQGLFIYNLGTGNGFSVLQMVEAFEKACGKKIPYDIKPRRPGDIAVCFADSTLAREKLGWTAQLTVDNMAADVWRWQSSNPNGYPSEA
jgi:UDP-glucose 4-epimerase